MYIIIYLHLQELEKPPTTPVKVAPIIIPTSSNQQSFTTVVEKKKKMVVSLPTSKQQYGKYLASWYALQ